MSYEVDVLAVGQESDSGDAIALRFGNYAQNPADQKIVVIDGGYQDSGKALVELIRNTYGSNRVDLVVSTHPDNDHVSGLHVVLEELEVGELWMHRPWNMSASIKKLAEEDRGLAALGLSSNQLKKSLEAAYDLEKLAVKRGVSRILDPFQGEVNFENTIYVLGPSRSYYQSLVLEFEKGGTVSSGLIKLKKMISEVWHKDELLEPTDDATSPRNNSSAILVAAFGDQHFLFTADAGVPALAQAADWALANKYDLTQKIKVLQIPHHGSKRNVGPAILDRLIGPIVAQGQTNSKGAFMSAAAKGEPHHPSKRVTNAIVRRGVKPHATQGQSFYYKSTDLAWRPGTKLATPIEFCASYDEED